MVIWSKYNIPLFVGSWLTGMTEVFMSSSFLRLIFRDAFI